VRHAGVGSHANFCTYGWKGRGRKKKGEGQ